MNPKIRKAIADRCDAHYNNIGHDFTGDDHWAYGYEEGAVEQDGIAREERTEEILKLLEDEEYADMNCKGQISRLIERIRQL